MQIFLRFFLIFVVLYHLFVTLFVYGVMKGQYYEIFSLSKDLLRIVLILSSIAVYFKNIKSYLKLRAKPIILFVILIVFGLSVSYFQGKTPYDMFIGLKYGFLYIFTFLSATWIGHNFAIKKNNDNMHKFISFLKSFLCITIILSLLRQALKFILPDFFQTIGYGPIGDYVFGQNPPLYYRTGPGGSPRLQGIFSGPNNYGYFLVAFFGVFISILNGYRNKSKDFGNFILIILRIISIILTISRSALIGSVLVLVLLNISRIKKHRKIFIGLISIFILAILGISILKGGSTLAHIHAKFSSLSYVFLQPLGYGLGTSGPAVFHNGSILPENYYIQLLLDIGAIGLLIRAILAKNISNIFNKIIKSEFIKKEEKYTYKIWLSGLFGLIGLLIIGLFLHVFEDSMINYLFFSVFGIITGYLYQFAIIHKNNKSNKNQ